MITEETVMTIFVEANPAPDVDELDLVQTGSSAYLATLEQRSSEVTQLDTQRKDQTKKRSVRPWLIAAVVIIVAGVAFILLNQGEEAPVAGQADADPAATIEAYITAYNVGDFDAVMELFSEESVITGHPFQRPGQGLEQIRFLQRQAMQMGLREQGLDPENVYTISNLEATGNTVTWDHALIKNDVVSSCWDGHSAVVEDGKIMTWTWPSPVACP